MKLLQVFKAINATETSLALSLARRPDIELTVMCSMDCQNHRRLLEAGIPVRPLDFRSNLDLPAMRRLRRELSQHRHHLVHAFTSRTIAGSLMATSWMWKRPAVVAYRDIMDRIRRYDPVSWMTFMHPRLAAISCISNSCRQGLQLSGIKRPLLRTIHLGYVPSPSEDCSFAQFGVPENAFVAAFVGDIRPLKGVDVLMEAARGLRDLDDLHFLLMGQVRDPRVVKLAGAAELRDRVHLAGHVPHAQRLLEGASLFVMPSRKEGLCKSVMEAMARGVCPIISNVGGMPELVRHERDGLVVPAGRPDELAAAIRRLHGDDQLRRSCAASAQQRILEEFSIARMTERTCQLYLEVLGQANPAHKLAA